MKEKASLTPTVMLNPINGHGALMTNPYACLAVAATPKDDWGLDVALVQAMLWPMGHRLKKSKNDYHKQVSAAHPWKSFSFYMVFGAHGL